MEQLPTPEQKKFDIDVTFDELAAVIPEFKRMVGFDQKNDYHTLALDIHTKEVESNLMVDTFIRSLKPRLQQLIRLAALMHDLGKADEIGVEGERGRQIHPDDPNKFRFIGHEKVSAAWSERLLRAHFDLTPQEIDFVVGLVAMHDEMMVVMNKFSGQLQPKKSKIDVIAGRSYNLPVGGELTPYGYLMDKIDTLPVDLQIKDKFNILIAFGLADKAANYNEEVRAKMETSVSETDRQKIAAVVEKCRHQLSALAEFRKAMPAIVDAVLGMRAGDNDQPKVVMLPSGEYIYDKNIQIPIPESLVAIDSLSTDQKKSLVKPFIRLRQNAADEDLSPAKDLARGLLKKKMTLSNAQISAVLLAAGFTPSQIEVILA